MTWPLLGTLFASAVMECKLEVEYVSGQPDIAVGARFNVHETSLFHCCECYQRTQTSFEIDKLFMTKIEKMTRHLLQYARVGQ